MVDLLHVCPRDVLKVFKKDVVAETRSRASERIRERYMQDLQDWKEPWWEVLGRLCNGRQLGPLQKHILMQVVTMTYPTKVQQSSWGLDTDGVCDQCDLGLPDTVEHRCWVCPA